MAEGNGGPNGEIGASEASQCGLDINQKFYQIIVPHPYQPGMIRKHIILGRPHPGAPLQRLLSLKSCNITLEEAENQLAEVIANVFAMQHQPTAEDVRKEAAGIDERPDIEPSDIANVEEADGSKKEVFPGE